jgi:hypothetical protein
LKLVLKNVVDSRSISFGETYEWRFVLDLDLEFGLEVVMVVGRTCEKVVIAVSGLWSVRG